MAQKTKIGWTDCTSNPIVGCTPVSDGCKNCYALRMARRLKGTGLLRYQGVVGCNGHWNGRIAIVPAELAKLRRMGKPRRIFLGSMSDLFHNSVPPGFLHDVFATIGACPQHEFTILTKRMGMAWHVLKGWLPLANLLIGPSIENERTADERMPPAIALAMKGWRIYVSNEPALGLVRWARYGLKHIAGLVCGGETGPGARPMHPAWARDARDACLRAGVPFFFKKWGGHVPYQDNGPLPEHCSYVGIDGTVRLGDWEADTDACMGRLLRGEKPNRLLDGVLWDGCPEREEGTK